MSLRGALVTRQSQIKSQHLLYNLAGAVVLVGLCIVHCALCITFSTVKHSVFF